MNHTPPSALSATLTAAAAALATPGSTSSVPPAWVQAYFGTSTEDSLRARSAASLAHTARLHWDLLQQRSADGLCVRVLRPHTADNPSAFALLQTVIEDMPFLVDSVLLRVREAGSAVDWINHAVVRVQRAPNGQLSALATHAAEPGVAESVIHIECEPLGSEAAYGALEQAVRDTLAMLRVAVADYDAMRVRIRQTIQRLERVPTGVSPSAFAEARAFLEWLDERQFTFLGWTESRAEASSGGAMRLVAQADTGLGLLRQGMTLASSEDLLAPQEELDKYNTSTRLVVFTKANARSPLYQSEYLDVIAIRRFGADGQLEGSVRIVGLFKSEAYHARVAEIPIVRRKVSEVMSRSALSEDSHAGRALREILETWPRDELFQSGEDELFAAASSMRSLRESHQIKLITRRDRYGRFYSCQLFMPRERYARELREALERELVAVFNASSVERTVDFMRGGFTRVHFILRTPPGTRVTQSTAEIEARLIAATRNWGDALSEALAAMPTPPEGAARFVQSFGLALQEVCPPATAAEHVALLASLATPGALAARLTVDGNTITGLTLYRRGNAVPLSDALPVLQNFGLKVLSQDPHALIARDGEPYSLQVLSVVPMPVPEGDFAALSARFEDALQQVWGGQCEDDALNALVLAAGLTARQVTALRTIATYLVQTALPFGPALIQSSLAQHAAIAKLLVEGFTQKFDPTVDASTRTSARAASQAALQKALDGVASLDADRILRAASSVLQAATRTNFFQADASGQPKAYVSIKLDPALIPDLPLPRPRFEIWVYAPWVEGVHLRGGKVARGGLRWSDRRQDFRTEVLGLMKAQMVKNTVIVPVGAKGGFVLKTGNPADREAWAKLGITGYQTFLRGLLDITDNRVGDAIVPPPQVVRYDEDDPYLVVAADKGTATFSDIANAISADYGHWLGDAFASGGSVGYDHKKMGITAKGAWESVQRHFREMGRNTQSEPFTVVGIGDMSGDVFGNGMLLSPHIVLLAAFDHRHIFLDPNPQAAASFAERARLFALPRSSWEDYDKTLISAGGGVYPRSAKRIAISPEVAAALGITEDALTPNALMQRILQAPVDLLWNGGIGTYVKASSQSHGEVGDRANDALRINGKDLRCKVMGEGGNLGCTQLGRIEAALHGVRLNTDAIDNAGGVHSSDREVNIKIPLNGLMAAGQLDRATRDPLLLSLTDELAAAVLRDNYVQSGAVSLLHASARERLDEHAELIRRLEREGLLNRAVEFLPDEDLLRERQRAGQGLSRPELAVLLAYAKMSLFNATLASDMPDDAFFVRDLLAYFPSGLVAAHRNTLEAHQLKREIIATILSNAVANRMGVSFAHRMAEDHGHSIGEVLKAYAIAHEIFGGDAYWQGIEALDHHVSAAVQLRAFSYPVGLLKHATGWLVRAGYDKQPVAVSVARFVEAIQAGERLLPDALPPSYRHDYDHTLQALSAEGIPTKLAQRLTATRVLGAALDVTELSAAHGMSLRDAAVAYFAVGEHFDMLWFYSAINRLTVSGKWHALARQNLRDDCYHIHRLLTGRVLATAGDSPEQRLQNWLAQHHDRVHFAQQRVAELKAAGAIDFEGLVVAVRELRKLRGL